ncbi:MAG TPA: ion transporter [Candidatus Paceibacterota bacterium]|nr:ion transporter [Candidatus Paceibacterota bacterium]
MMSLALVSGCLLVTEFVVPLSAGQIQLFDAIDFCIGFVFLCEFVIKLILAPNKWAYWRSNWWYLLASIPISTPATQALRLLRLIRLARLLRLGEGTKEIRRFASGTHLAYILTVWGIIVFLGTLAFFAAEHATNPHVGTLFDSFWWAISTVTTIGYGDIYPMTVAGRLIAIVLMITGVGTSGIFTALVAKFFLEDRKS